MDDVEQHDDPPAAATVLVVVMRDRADWARLQTEGWYRVPVRRAPRQAAADYLAFYHTAAFAEEKWSIRTYAPVRAVRVARRRDLLPAEADHPRAGDAYFRFDLGPLLALEQPVFSRRLRRITFIHTTLERLQTAGDVSELWITQPLRERLWVELNRQGIHAEQTPAELVIPCRQVSLTVECLPMQGTAGPREGSLTLPDQAPPETNGMVLRFEDAGWPARLAPYIERIRAEMARLDGPLEA
jgi:hypothetical protein